MYLKANLWSFVFSTYCLLTIPSANLDRPMGVAFMFSLCVFHVPQAKVIGTMQWNYYWKKKSHLPIHFLSSQWLPNTIVLPLFSPLSSEKRKKILSDIPPRYERAATVSQHPSGLKPKASWSQRIRFWAHWIIWQKTQAGWTYGAWDSERIVLKTVSGRTFISSEMIWSLITTAIWDPWMEFNNENPRKSPKC